MPTAEAVEPQTAKAEKPSRAAKKRYYVLDAVRGFAVVNMIFYHAVWDAVNVFDVNWEWFDSLGAHIWQQCICCVFIFVSGFCFLFDKKPLKRGLCVFAAGAAVSVVTKIFMPDDIIIFGILTLIGSCILFMAAFGRITVKINPLAGEVACVLLFAVTKNVNDGFLGFGGLNFAPLPEFLYRNLFTAFFGFPPSDFYSTDYFSLVPWLFLYLAGHFAYLLLAKKERLGFLCPSVCKPLEIIGRKSFLIYLAHQPAVYGLLYVFFSVVKK